MAPAIPAVEIAEHRHRIRIRRPDRETRAFCAVHRDPVGPESLVEAAVGPFLEKMDIVRRQRSFLRDQEFDAAVNRSHDVGLRRHTARVAGKMELLVLFQYVRLCREKFRSVVSSTCSVLVRMPRLPCSGWNILAERPI